MMKSGGKWPTQLVKKEGDRQPFVSNSFSAFAFITLRIYKPNVASLEGSIIEARELTTTLGKILMAVVVHEDHVASEHASQSMLGRGEIPIPIRSQESSK